MPRRATAAVAFGPYATTEARYAAALWPYVPDASLIIVDRGFLAAGTLIPLAAGGAERHWLARGRTRAPRRSRRWARRTRSSTWR